MNLTNKTTVKDLLKRHEIKPEKYLGQHFILSKKALAQMVAAAEIKKNDTIIEVGSGLGTLTQELVKIPHPFSKGGGLKIIAIEKDPKMINILEETLAGHKNIKIVQADVRNLWVSETYKFGDKLGIKIAKNKYKIVANLPYYISNLIIRKFLESKNPPKLMVLMIQKEVAQRICGMRMNLLAISVQFYADVKIVDYVPAEAFWPKPKVDSAIIKIVPTGGQPQKMRRAFFAVVKAGFSQPRKQLIGNLAKKLKVPREKLFEIFKNLNISERVRAENLSLEQWRSLANSL
jgi:16S rRNA (adenine1518-N6/adenine1519-N6)-dimethyltransferase